MCFFFDDTASTEIYTLSLHDALPIFGILYLTTCVGLGYGPLGTSLEAFLGSIGSLTSPESARHHVSAFMRHGFAYGTAYTLTPAQPPAGISYLPASPPRLTTTHKGPGLPHRRPKPLTGSSG